MPAAKREYGVPKTNFAKVIESVCEKWQVEHGEKVQLFVKTQRLMLKQGQAALLARAVFGLLSNGLSVEPSPEKKKVGVSLWKACFFDRRAILLIADDGKSAENKPVGVKVVELQQLVEDAQCKLYFEPSRGAVWRLYI